MNSENQPFQDTVPTHCFGCGTLNEHGLGFKSHWDGERMHCTWRPQPYHKAGPDILYGGLIASLIDCQCGVTTTAAIYREEDREIGSEPLPKSVTANLNITYLKPIPLDADVTSECWVEKMEGRKLYLKCTIASQGETCAEGTALYIKLKTG